jgi:hypothetical protein
MPALRLESRRLSYCLPNGKGRAMNWLWLLQNFDWMVLGAGAVFILGLFYRVDREAKKRNRQA